MAEYIKIIMTADDVIPESGASGGIAKRCRKYDLPAAIAKRAIARGVARAALPRTEIATEKNKLPARLSAIEPAMTTPEE